MATSHEWGRRRNVKGREGKWANEYSQSQVASHITVSFHCEKENEGSIYDANHMVYHHTIAFVAIARLKGPNMARGGVNSLFKTINQLEQFD